MHIQIINFNLDGISRSEYEQVCDDLAQTFADVPGLISKHWLANDDTNTFGGVYMFESKDAYEAFIGSELFAAVGGNPALANISSKDFGVIEGPTRITRGMVVFIAPRQKSAPDGAQFLKIWIRFDL